MELYGEGEGRCWLIAFLRALFDLRLVGPDAEIVNFAAVAASKSVCDEDDAEDD